MTDALANFAMPPPRGLFYKQGLCPTKAKTDNLAFHPAEYCIFVKYTKLNLFWLSDAVKKSDCSAIGQVSTFNQLNIRLVWYSYVQLFTVGRWGRECKCGVEVPLHSGAK
jgi:hypothetical protein